MTRVELRPTTLDDVDHIMTWVNDPALTAYFSWKGPVAREDEAAYLSKMLVSAHDRLFSIFSDGAYAGQCSLNQIYWRSHSARLFVVVTSAMQGKGVARAAIGELLRVAFEELELHKVWLIVRRDNERGLHLYHRAGFRVEGTLEDEYELDGAFLTMTRMAILDDVYRRWYRR